MCLISAVTDALPRGRLLTDESWNRRHRWIVVLVALHAVGLAGFGAFRGFGVLHSVLEAGVIGALALLASRSSLRRVTRSISASLGLVGASALVVHFANGNIESHFHFFFVLSVLILYQDWMPFLLAIAFVVVHHGALGALASSSVYNHPGAVANPWRWALLHGVYVLATTAASVVSWRVNEQLLHEPLTGLPGRPVFLHRVSQAIETANRTRGCVAVMFLDLDRFKVLNDNLGHAAGDRLLIAAATRIKEAVRADDVVARLGGDEFAILFEGLEDEDEAIRIARRIREQLAALMVLDGVEVTPVASIGIAYCRHDGRHAEGLLADADVAMYRAKKRGDGFVVFGEEMRRQAFEQLEIEVGLRGALERDELLLHYQPIVSIGESSTGDVVGVEALLRWQHPERGLIAPADFIPTAEETGLIVPIGAWVLQQACAEAAGWDSPGAPYISINLSSRQVADQKIVETVRHALDQSGLEPQRLALEITESIFLNDENGHVATLEALRELGVSIVLDDFGTGYSSLSYLTRFPIEALKVDRSFISNLDRSADDEAVVSAIAGMARALGLTLIAEGVETEQQTRALRLLGIRHAQGFYFERPCSSAQLRKHLHEHPAQASADVRTLSTTQV